MDSRRITRTILLALLRGVLLWLAAAAAWAAPVAVDGELQSRNLAPDVEVLEDAGGKLTLAQVEALPPGAFRPSGVTTGDINFGYTPAAYWLRFTLAPAANAPRDWLLEVAFPSLDHLEVHAPDGPAVAVGDHLPFAARPLANRNFVFPLRLAGDGPQTFYLRVASEGTLTVPLRLWQPDAFDGYSLGAYAALSLYYGMLLALMLYNLLLYLSIRDRSYLAYVAFVASMAVGQLSLNGLGNQYLWPDWPAWGNVALPCGFAATGFFGTLFTRSFLKTAGTAPRFDALLRLFAVTFAAAMLAPALISYHHTAVLVAFLGASFPLLAVFAGVACLRRGQPGAPYFLVAWTLLLVGVSAFGLRSFGWLPTNFVTSYGMQIGSALEMLLLSFALADRINAVRREKEQAQSEALAAKQQMVDHLQQSERELEHRVAERTAELAEANTRLRENERTLQEMAHRDPLTGLANRLLLDARLEHAVQRSHRSGNLLAVLLADLDGFKPVNDSYGHAVGDQLLQEVGRRLAGAVRQADTVGRLGGDEFVVVLEDIKDEGDATRLAEKVIGELGRPFVFSERQLNIGASVGIALYAGDGGCAAELLRRADTAMYLAKSGGRGRFELFPFDLAD